MAASRFLRAQLVVLLVLGTLVAAAAGGDRWAVVAVMGGAVLGLAWGAVMAGALARAASATGYVPSGEFAAWMRFVRQSRRSPPFRKAIWLDTLGVWALAAAFLIALLATWPEHIVPVVTLGFGMVSAVGVSRLVGLLSPPSPAGQRRDPGLLWFSALTAAATVGVAVALVVWPYSVVWAPALKSAAVAAAAGLIGLAFAGRFLLEYQRVLDASYESGVLLGRMLERVDRGLLVKADRQAAEDHRREIEALRDDLTQEVSEIRGKLPWYKKLLMAATVIAFAAACGAASIATGGAAIAFCIAAILALLAMLLELLAEGGDIAGERRRIEEKRRRARELEERCRTP